MSLYLGVVNNGTFVTSDNYTLIDSNDEPLVAQSSTSKWKIVINGVTYHVNINLKESD